MMTRAALVRLVGCLAVLLLLLWMAVKAVVRPAFVVLLLASPAWAQQTRTILQIPVNFQNDTRQPRTLAQLKADAETSIAKLLFENSYGTVTATSTVWDYVTLPMDKGCASTGRSLPPMNMTEFYAKLDAGLAARGQARTGFTYIYIMSPTTWGQCSHDYQYGLETDVRLGGGTTMTGFAWRSLGLGMSLNRLCRAAAGSSTYVTLSTFCTSSPSSAGGRDFTSITGQGLGSFTARDRDRLGWLPASQQFTAPATTTRGQWTITRLEHFAAGLKRLRIPAMAIELSYHAPKTSVSWDTRGVTGHLDNTSIRLDFTPDDRWIFGTTALEPGATWVYNNLRLTTLSADLDVAVVDLRPASEPAPALPAGPRCATTSPDPSINVTTLTDGACGVWKILPDRRVYRNGTFYAGNADALTFCRGTVYVPNGALWSRYARGTTGEAMVPMAAPATPPCDGSSLPPPDDPPPPPPPPPPPLTSDCYADNAARILPTRLAFLGGLTREKCIAAAKSKGLPWAGVEFSGECWGGATQPSDTLKRPASECTMPCRGDQAQICGGGWRINVLDAR